MTFFKNIITNEKDLEALLGTPNELVKNKVIPFLDEGCSEFISKSPLLFIATSDKGGFCDVSPRGDAPGFVSILDSTHLVIPERPGNRRADSMRNILSNPKVGLLFLIPGLEETLRINGSACIVTDQDLLEPMAVRGKSPIVALGITVEECYVHCAKAFKRSELWDKESWLQKERLPNPAKMIAAHTKVEYQTVKQALEESYTKRLY